VEAVEKERAIWERLERIDGLREEEAPAGVLLEEVRALLSEAEAWVREEPAASERVVQALDRSKAALAAGEQRTVKLLLDR
jgi:predicted metal-dependent hydrolase